MPKPPDGKAARPVPKNPGCGLRGIASLVHYRRLAPGKPGRTAKKGKWVLHPQIKPRIGG
jgi:hypothetical protein